MSYPHLATYRSARLRGLIVNGLRQADPNYPFIDACKAELAKRPHQENAQ